MVQYKPLPSPLTEDDLPETDNQPVDNELQVLIPILLRAILALLWARTDWFLGVKPSHKWQVTSHKYNSLGLEPNERIGDH